MSLRVYNRKRKFKETPEPRGKVRKGKGPLRFVVQMHDATRMHFDLRLEFDGVFKSWAVPKGPSLNPLDQRLAVFVEDHPLDYGSFEGIIPGGNYGAGTVMVWDEGTYIERGSKGRDDSEAAIRKAFAKGHMTFVLDGQKLKGEFALIKLKKDAGQKAWLLVKKRDEHSTFKRGGVIDNTSVKTGRTMQEIAAEAEGAGDVWLSKRKTGKSKPKPKQDPDPKRDRDPKRDPKPDQKSGRRTEHGGLRTEKRTTRKERGDLIPRKNKPMLATLTNKPLEGKDWLYEESPGGLRALAEVEGTRVHLYSKSGLPFEKKFPLIVNDLKKQKSQMVLDGEIVKEKNAYHVYDILFADGKDLRHSPLKERKAALEKLLITGKHVHLVESSAKRKAGVVIAKKADSLYYAGTSKEWLQLPEEKASKAAGAHDDLRLTHLDKVYFPKDELTKGDLIEYYRAMAPYILPHLKDRPQSLNRFPNGIGAKGFYQKDVTGYKPRWLKTERIYSESNDKSIDYAVCQDERSLLYLVNLGCIEMNPWFSRVGHLDKPDFLVIDLDPDGNEFHHVIEVAHTVREILESVGATAYCKTSGATGIHIGVPTGARYTFDEVRAFAEDVCKVVAKRFPATTSMHRNPNRRQGKIYLDYMQNRLGQTLASAFCIRPKEGAPVSMPLDWKNLTKGLEPGDFNISNALRRVQKFGDSWKPVLGKPINLHKCAQILNKKYGAD